MNIDTFLKIGHSHTICQDYILSGEDPVPFIILADGCSQAKDSDIGARILCHAALEQLKVLQSYLATVEPMELGQWIINKAYKAKKSFYTDIDCLDATLIVAYKFEGNYYVYMYGDGIIHTIGPDNNSMIIRRYYKPNAPAYLRYRMHGYKQYKESNVASFLEITNLCDQVADDVMEPTFFKINEGNVKDLMIASDGVESFIHKEELMYKSMFLSLSDILKNYTFAQGETLSDKFEEKMARFYIDEKEIKFKTVIEDMLNFKLTKGSFLKRRVKKVMREYLKKGFINDDDLSIGCFHEEW